MGLRAGQRQKLQPPARCVTTENATLIIPVAQHGSSRRLAVKHPIMKGWPVGMTVNQARDAMSAHDLIDFSPINIGDVSRFLLDRLPAGFS